jgi:eukaryotic-like serine/threonine-protein kinase
MPACNGIWVLGRAMHADRWKRVNDLFKAAQAQPTAERAEFLRQACPSDPGLCSEVESLLKEAETQAGLLESRPLSSSAPQPTPKLGGKLGRFEILSHIGSGGMGEVWRARDERLNREVAIKVLPASLARDPDRLSRLKREAQASSALNHPNIVAVHELGEYEGGWFIVSELVDGETLARLMERGHLAFRKVVEVGTQVCDGLAAAHAAGVIHRDLKPGNIMLTRDGRVKILDFGLAKQVRGPETMTLTHPGGILGTPGYMSPEQVRGEQVDHRSDLFSVGVILYEMLAGKRAFSGSSSVEVMNAILTEEPPPLPATVPGLVESTVRRCLEKDRERRFHSASDLAFAVRSFLSPFPAKPSKRRTWSKWALLVPALTAILGGTVSWLFRPLPQPRVTGMKQITRDAGLVESTICPLLTDGSRLFYCSSQAPVKGGELVSLTLQTPGQKYLPDINGEGTEVLICRYTKYPLCELWAEPLVGGSPRRLGSIISNNSGAWSPDGQHLVYSRDGEVHLATRDGTEIRTLAKFPSTPSDFRWAPDSRRISFAAAMDGSPYRLWQVSRDGAVLREMLAGWNPSWSLGDGVWTADGRYYAFISEGGIWVVRDQPASPYWSRREPVHLNTGLVAPQHPVPSADGKRLFFVGAPLAPRNEFIRYDLKSRRFSLEFPGISGSYLEYSKDGKWVTYVSASDRTLFRMAEDGSQRIQLTWPPMGVIMGPRWSPDGKQIAFGAGVPSEPNGIYVVSADGGAPRRISGAERKDFWDPSWSPDGASVAFDNFFWEQPDNKFIRVVDLKTDDVAALPGSRGISHACWSPDGRWIAGFSADGLMLYDLQNQTQTKLTDMGGRFSWSRNSEFLFLFNGFNGGSWWRIRIRDRKLELITKIKDIRLADWGWLSIAPGDDAIITAQNIGSGEIYALDLELP